MAVYGRTIIQEKPNFVNPPTLPVDIVVGSISWSKSLEGHGSPIVTLDYEQVSLQEIQRLENAYTPGLVENSPIKITLFDIPLQVASFQYDRAKYIYNGTTHFDRYKVSVGLEWVHEKAVSANIKVFRFVPLGSTSISVSKLAAAAKVPYKGPSFDIEIPANSDKDFGMSLGDAVTKRARSLGCFVVYADPGIELRKIDSVRSWNFIENDVIADGGNTLKGAIAYNRAEMTFGTESKDDKDPDAPPGVKLTKKAPVIETTRDLDSDDPSSPPANSSVLKSIDSNSVDGQGPKLTDTTTTTQDGQTMRVDRKIYGFLYTAKDIHIGDGVLQGTPSNYWQLIEQQIEEHVYTALSNLSLSIVAKDPDPQYAKTSLGGRVTLIINPDYDSFVSGSALGGSATFRSTAKYLVQIKTTGWAYRRLIKETDALETIDLDATDPTYQYYFFKKIPITGETNYYLVSPDEKYGEGGAALPFSVQWKTVEELTPDEKRKVSSSNITEGGKVGVLTPDVNYTQPMQVLFEGTSKNSFAWAPNPEFDKEDASTYCPLTTGEESYDTTWRTIIDANHYRERQTSFSASNSDYANLAESIKVRYATGRPPEGTTLKETWETSDKKKNILTFGGTKNKRYFVTTDLVGNTPEGGSVSGTSDAKNLDEAKLALKTDLRIQGWSQGNQETKTVSWYYPDIEPGDIISVPARRFQKYGQLRVTGVGWSMKFDGYGNNPYRNPWVTTDGTKLTLGVDLNRTFSIETVDVPSTNNTAASGDPTLSVTSSGGTKAVGIPMIPGANRRRF